MVHTPVFATGTLSYTPCPSPSPTARGSSVFLLFCFLFFPFRRPGCIVIIHFAALCKAPRWHCHSCTLLPRLLAPLNAHLAFPRSPPFLLHCSYIVVIYSVALCKVPGYEPVRFLPLQDATPKATTPTSTTTSMTMTSSSGSRTGGGGIVVNVNMARDAAAAAGIGRGAGAAVPTDSGPPRTRGTMRQPTLQDIGRSPSATLEASDDSEEAGGQLPLSREKDAGMAGQRQDKQQQKGQQQRRQEEDGGGDGSGKGGVRKVDREEL